MQRAVNVGAVIKTAVSRKTDFLVVGRQFAGPDGVVIPQQQGRRRPVPSWPRGKTNLRILNEAEFSRLLQGSLSPATPPEPPLHGRKVTGQSQKNTFFRREASRKNVFYVFAFFRKRLAISEHIVYTKNRILNV